MLRIEGKNILVTGGASGIGLEITKALCVSNTVYVVDRDNARLSDLKSSHNVEVICVDLMDWDKTREALDSALPELVHGVVNNAGVGSQAGFLSVTNDALDTVLGVNTRAIVNVSQIVAKRLIQHNSKTDDKAMCSIVNISSLASRFPTRISTAYNLSKAAVDMLTKSMALEWGPHNIRVNSVNPNIVMTELAEAWIAASGSQLKEKLLARTPLGKLLEIKDVVNAVLFLLWDGVTMIHGESLFVDGGYSVT
ncbi:D-erythrulose reductase [Orchesella cincta]|uniref:D-erythrulose reductase n=1 Tax=Orchesella cincta TaxID=48709 RepID=A0A1D2NHN8_ORCCI|nr:D-erythrulose reductase [Orchesella cincta]